MVKIDRPNSSSITNDVSFKAMTSNGDEIDSSLYEGVNAVISYPINEELLDLTTGDKMAEQGIDIFNASDSFFNDLCYPYSTENDTDIIIKDRRNDLYNNVSFCDSNCRYEGVNYTTKTVNCNCSMTQDET